MKFNQTPHPQIEDHYHIQELINSQEKRYEDRQKQKDLEKQREERDKLIADSKLYTVVEFWCDRCKEDFKAWAVKQIEEDWYLPQRNSFYKTKCWNNHWCIRLVTDKHKDGFYYKSKLVAKDRANHIDDVLQPYETGFNMLYGKK